MKNVRVFFTQKGRLRFVSHLDMNRFFTRVLRLSGLPVWYTEGFNQHVYLTFALPLSLGFESEYSAFDFRVTDDTLDYDTIRRTLARVVPDDIMVLSCAEPVMKPGVIASVKYRIRFEETRVAEDFFTYIGQKDLVIVKTTKRGQEKEIAVSTQIKQAQLDGLDVTLVLPAGNDTVNPSLLLKHYQTGREDVPHIITRLAIYNADGRLFC